MMLHILIDNPLLTFCIVAALGYLLGRVRIGDSSPGTAAVLFAGLFVGAIDPRLKLPDALYLHFFSYDMESAGYLTAGRSRMHISEQLRQPWSLHQEGLCTT